MNRLLVATLALGCAARPIRGGFQLHACAPAAERAECGFVEVPEDPIHRDGRKLRLEVVVLRAVEPRAGTVPLFHLEGGPGVAATAATPFYQGPGREYRRHRDVVLVDQRGTGSSNPLRCPEIEARKPWQEQYTERDVAACRSRLEAVADLGKYGTSIAAGDLDEVRAALGYEQIDLWALSYGTQLAQVYLREYPSRVRRAVLTGVAPLDFRSPLHHAANAQRVLDLLLAQCRADPACHAAYPELGESWRTLRARLRAGPVLDAATGVEIARGPFGEALRRLLNTTTGQRRVPFLIARAAAGDFGPFLDALSDRGDPVAEGLYLSNVCAEGTLRIEADEISRATDDTFLGDYRVRNQLEACRRWPTVPIDPRFFTQAHPRIPILMLAGEMDATTPPAYATALCSSLASCRTLIIPALAHGPFDLDQWQAGDCFDRMAVDFFDRPDPSALDTQCLRVMKPPPFFVGR